MRQFGTTIVLLTLIAPLTNTSDTSEALEVRGCVGGKSGRQEIVAEGAPQILDPIGRSRVLVGHLLRLEVLATDPQGGAVTYEIDEESLPEGAVFALLGDVDDDGVLTVADVVRVVNLRGLVVSSAIDAIADIDGDGFVGEADEQLLVDLVSNVPEQSALLAWVPGATMVGDYVVPVSATDVDGFSIARDIEFSIKRQRPGDCDGDGAVSESELQIGVEIYLDERPLSECDSFDLDGDGVVKINELLSVISDRCPGDCNRDDVVGIDDLVFGVSILLGQRPLWHCGNLDMDLSAVVTVDELVQAIQNSLSSCGFVSAE